MRGTAEEFEEGTLITGEGTVRTKIVYKQLWGAPCRPKLA